MWPVAGLVIVGIAFAALFPVARRVHAYLDEKGNARSVAFGLCVFLVALIPISRLLATASDRMRERALDKVAASVVPVLDAVAKGAVGPLDENSPGATLLTLLRGREIQKKPRVRYFPLEVGESGSERLSAEGNFPFRVLNRQVRAGETLAFPVERLNRIARLGFALPTRVGGLEPILDIGIVRRSGERREFVLDTDVPRFHGWGEGIQLVEVRQLNVDPPIDDAVSVEVRSRGVPTPIFGLCGFDGARSSALSPEDVTRTGLPVRLVVNSTGRGIPVVPGGTPVEFALDDAVDCDRLWLVYEATDPRAMEYRWFGEDIIDVRLDYSDGRPSEQHTLKHGEDLHSANLDRSRHAEDLQSVVAFIGEEDGVRTHTDQRLWVLSGPRKLKKITLRNLSGTSGYTVSLMGLTAGLLDSAPSELDDAVASTMIVKEGAKMRLREDVASGFLGVRFAFVDRRGIIRSTEPDAAPHFEGASLDDREVNGIVEGRALSATCTSIVGIDGDVAILPVKMGDARAGALVLFVPEPNRAQRRGSFDMLPLIAALLALPYLLVSFAETLSRGERIRRKIAVALAVAAVVPLLVVFVIVRSAFESSRSNAARQKLNADMQLLRERFTRERELASTTSGSFFRAFREHPRIEPLFLPPPRPDAESILRRELKTARERISSSGRTFVRFESRIPAAGASSWKTIDDVADDFVKLNGAEFQGTDYYFVNGRLLLVGVDRWSQGELRGRLALGTEVTVPVEKASTVWLMGLDGTLVNEDEWPATMSVSTVRAAIENALRTNRPVPIAGDGVGLLDVFRDRDGNPAFAFVAHERPASGDIALFGTRVSLGVLLGFVTILGAVGALAVSRILTDRLTDPIEKLASASEGARGGHGFIPVVTDATDEIGVLSDQFQSLSTELVRRIQHLDEIQRGMLGFAGRLNREEVAREACRFAAAASRADLALLWLPEPQWKGFRVFDSFGNQRQRKATPLVQRIMASDAWTIVSGVGASVDDALSTIDKTLTVPITALLGGPVRLGNREEGWLTLVFSGRSPDVPQREAARAAAGSIALALENSRTYELAIEDGLTGAFVSQHFELRLSEAIERARALGRSLHIVRFGITLSEGGKGSAEQALQLVARRFVRLAARTAGALVGRIGPLDIAYVAGIGGAEERQRFLHSLRSLAQRHAAGRKFEFLITDTVFPDESPSAEAVLSRLRSGSLDLATSTVDIAQFVNGTPPVSPAMRDAVIRAARLAHVDISVLIEGEPGVGKAELARQIHRAGGGDDTSLVEVYLAALNPNLAEAELFGSEIGAYSGAVERKLGLLEQANGGTIILNEIGDTPLDVQSKLLRALQDRRIRRLGSRDEVPLKLRVISTSSKDLRLLVQEGHFRQDLFYRIAGGVVHLPPLRGRTEDIPALAARVLSEIDSQRNYVLTPRALDRLLSHSWPGNLTELRSTLRRSAIMVGTRDEIDSDDIEIVRASAPTSLSEPRFEPRRVPRLSTLTGVGTESKPRRMLPDSAWNERQRRLLAMLARGERITVSEYIRVMNISSRTGLRDLAELVRKGRLRRDGRKRGTTYRLV